jgi:uncharacterized protein YndB with AHSA1/START domain
MSLSRRFGWCRIGASKNCMRTFTKSIDIAARPERVWRILIDVERWPEWTRSMQTVRRLEGGTFGMGSSAWISQPKLRPAVWTVTQFEPGRSFTWTAKAPGLRVLGTHSVQPVDEGSQVTLSVQFNGLLGGLLARYLAKLNNEYLALEAEGLKKRSEKIGT